MTPKNRKTEPETEAILDAAHELPPAQDDAGPAAAVLPEELHKLQDEREMLYDRLARLQAEFDNYRKRVAREQSEFRDYAVADAARLFLPVLDSLERALQHPGEGEFRSGVELIHRQLLDALGKLGVQPLVALGQPFDPALHQAVEVVETTAVPDHHVVDELQRGYKIKERLLRPAMVRVAKHP